MFYVIINKKLINNTFIYNNMCNKNIIILKYLIARIKFNLKYTIINIYKKFI